ncbi:hypothetical protein C3747_155g21 [Trypanosoma cruzi]|uniref:CCDC81 HU domain-containing protein n=2 Tax=Trypanosoma cruzi TaxID=5693 RepID=Q4CUT8_TRYCC|nr:hypothetical protein, conserved [Trypanosoma cruzi]EAN84038.1 hypothetical protein, conserved [Trypanosoma cruzi]PWV04303.1 hypothetical protein C3747_155g21 [Trypanosoma cruzi]RNC60624.1 hypothetical protein TcCL_ESM01612 [Trypanosoma cruzi]|eukprot:XP_805889.1 hypothetical protein [Trypanosoma cruzi strain CL Brener]
MVLSSAPESGGEKVGMMQGELEENRDSLINSTECYACYGEIASIVASTQGLYYHQTRGNGGTDLLNRIWRSMGELLEEQLLLKRSCIVTDFFHASVKVQNIQYYDGKHVFYKLQLVLLPDFTSKFHLQNVLTIADAQYHASVPHIISYSKIADRSGTDRFVVEAAIRDSTREIGKYLMRNAKSVLRIDIGIAFLEFRGREYRIKWTEEFLQRFRKAVGPRSVVSPYDPPLMSPAATGCRFQTACLSEDSLHKSLINTVRREGRPVVVEMNSSGGGSWL